MSTAKFDTLSNLAGTLTIPVDTVAQGTARAWVNFNGTGTVAIRASFNVSSITDNGTGDYTVNFTNSLVDGSYVVSGSAATSTTLDANQYNRGVTLCSQTFSTGSFRIRASNLSSGAVEDSAIVAVTVNR
jgi:hypothetical protein